ncbi:Ataxin-7-like protein 3 [Coemansia sp. BCRC 34962]|nr:Ataxin-7-like protein 3 [Coemansia sp. BCRC 34962]
MKAKEDIDGSGAVGSNSDKKSAAIEVFEELLKYYESKIDALKQTRDALESAHTGSTSSGNSSSSSGHGSDDAGSSKWSRALLAMELFAEMIDDMMMDVVFETHVEAKQCASSCAVCSTQCQSDANVVQMDVTAADGSSPGVAADLFECPNCQRPYPAARFASHMDKCMGLSSRRAATRSAVSTPSYPAASYESSSEHSMDRKRKPAVTSSSAAAKDSLLAASGRKKAKRK